MTAAAAISTNIIQATDHLLSKAVEAIDASAADWNGPMGAQHTLLVPGDLVREVKEAMDAWTMASCEPGGCERWDHQQAAAAQNAFVAVEQVFDLPPSFLSSPSEARIPVSVMGSHLAEVQIAQARWAQAWQPPRRHQPRC
jgi:hypothetical protein